jgi:hypothetical protein
VASNSTRVAVLDRLTLGLRPLQGERARFEPLPDERLAIEQKVRLDTPEVTPISKFTSHERSICNPHEFEQYFSESRYSARRQQTCGVKGTISHGGAPPFAFRNM